MRKQTTLKSNTQDGVVQPLTEWAQKCINNEKKLLDMEKDEEDFRKIRHGM